MNTIGEMEYRDRVFHEKCTVGNIERFALDFGKYMAEEGRTVDQENPTWAEVKGKECGCCMAAHMAHFFFQNNVEYGLEANQCTDATEDRGAVLDVLTPTPYDPSDSYMEYCQEVARDYISRGDYDDDLVYETDEFGNELDCAEPENLDEVEEMALENAEEEGWSDFCQQTLIDTGLISEYIFDFNEGRKSLAEVFGMNMHSRPDFWVFEHVLKELVGTDPFGAEQWKVDEKDYVESIRQGLLIYRAYFMHHKGDFPYGANFHEDVKNFVKGVRDGIIAVGGLEMEDANNV